MADTDNLSDRDLLIRLDERSDARSEQLDKIEKGVGAINGRLREVETEQTAIRTLMNMVTGAGGIISGAFTAVLAWLKLDA